MADPKESEISDSEEPQTSREFVSEIGEDNRAELLDRLVREHLAPHAREIAQQIAASSPPRYQAPTGNSRLLEDAVREALAKPAQDIAQQIASLNDLRYQAIMGKSPLLEDAVREALRGPAREIAEQIALTSSLRFPALYGRSPLLENAVKEALEGPAKEIAEEIAHLSAYRHPSHLDGSELDNLVHEELSSKARGLAAKIGQSSLAWLRNYSSQALEPTLYSEVARVLASDSMDSPQSDYEPLPIGGPAGASAPSVAIFERYEITVKSFRGLVGELDRLTRKVGPYSVSWRGQANAAWGLHSTLWRELQRESQSADRGNRLPSEDAMVAAERYLLGEIRDRWRLGNAPGVGLLARMQHRGVPTRLLDATRNPFLALWFAASGESENDGRLFAIAHRPISPRSGSTVKSLDDAIWSDPRPFWFEFQAPSDRVVGAWGTGTRIREVIPPDYDKRILAQNAVFLLDGLPGLPGSVLEEFNRVSRDEWTPSDIATSMSIVLVPGDPRHEINSTNPFAVVYSLRIPQQLKAEIRATLKRTYGLDWETIYPDIEGLRAFLDEAVGWSLGVTVE